MKKIIVIIIFLNWVLSICGLSIDTDKTPLWGIALMFAWFAVSCALLKCAQRMITNISNSGGQSNEL